MKNRPYGGIPVYATDKNVSDALKSHRVDSKTLAELFLARNTIVSVKTNRAKLATEFCKLTHDFSDHQRIAARLGAIARRERSKHVFISEECSTEKLREAITQTKERCQDEVESFNFSKTADGFRIEVAYIKLDYAKSEFSQVQHRDGTIEIELSKSGSTVRTQDNEFMSSLQKQLTDCLSEALGKPLDLVAISLEDLPEPRTRSRFFELLTSGPTGYSRMDIPEIFVYRPKPSDWQTDDDEEEEPFESSESMIERVMLRGSNVNRAQMLHELYDMDYYVVKAGWNLRNLDGAGTYYELEAVFSDPPMCSDFSFIVKAVNVRQEARTTYLRRTPTRDEVSAISRRIEMHARSVMEDLRSELANSSEADNVP